MNNEVLPLTADKSRCDYLFKKYYLLDNFHNNFHYRSKDTEVFQTTISEIQNFKKVLNTI